MNILLPLLNCFRRPECKEKVILSSTNLSTFKVLKQDSSLARTNSLGFHYAIPLRKEKQL